MKIHVFFSIKQYKEHEKYFFQYDIFDANTGAGILSGKADADPRVITSSAIAYKKWYHDFSKNNWDPRTMISRS